MKTSHLAGSSFFTHTNQDLVSRQKDWAGHTHGNEALPKDIARSKQSTFLSEKYTESVQISANEEAKVKELLSSNNESEIWLSKPKFLTKNQISNPKGVTQTSYKLLSQLSNPNITNKLSKGLSEVGELLNKHVGKIGYEQTLTHYSGYAQARDASNGPSLKIYQISPEKTYDKQSLDFTLTTVSGKRIHFSLSHSSNELNNADNSRANPGISFSSISVRFEQSETLNEEEQKEVAQLTKNMEQFFTDFFEKDQANFGLLKLNDFTQIQDLSLHGKNPNSKSQLTRLYGLSFEYSNNEMGRHIKASFKNNHAQMHISKTELFNKNIEHRQQALQHYLSLLDESKEKSKASQMQIDMMSIVFELGFKPSAKEKAQLEKDNVLNKQMLNAKETSQAAKSKQVFIPLPDFSFSFKSNKSDKREHENFNTISEFDLSLSLESIKTKAGSKITLEQKQAFSLIGNYTQVHPRKPQISPNVGSSRSSHGGLPRTEVYYKYQANKDIRGELQKGLLISATVNENNLSDVSKRSYGTNPRTGEADALLYQEHKITQSESLKDYTQRLLAKDELDTQALLEETLIDPFKEGKMVFFEHFHYLDEYFATHPYQFPLASNSKT